MRQAAVAALVLAIAAAAVTVLEGQMATADRLLEAGWWPRFTDHLMRIVRQDGA